MLLGDENSTHPINQCFLMQDKWLFWKDLNCVFFFPIPLICRKSPDFENIRDMVTKVSLYMVDIMMDHVK